MMPPRVGVGGGDLQKQSRLQDRLEQQNVVAANDQEKFSGRFEIDGRGPKPGNIEETIIFSAANGGLAF